MWGVGCGVFWQTEKGVLGEDSTRKKEPQVRVRSQRSHLSVFLFRHHGDFPTHDSSQLYWTWEYPVPNCPNVCGAHTPLVRR